MRLLALIPPGTNSRSIFMDMLRGMQLAASGSGGHTVFFEDISFFITESQKLIQASGGKPTDALRGLQTTFVLYLEALFARRGCDAIVTLWVDPLMALPFAKPDPKVEHFASFTEILGIPTIHYWLDAPFWAYEGRLLPALDKDRLTSPLHNHIINNSGTAEEMRRVLGFKSVHAIPYGVDESIFRPWPMQRQYDLLINAGPGDPPPTELMKAELAKEVPDVQSIRRDQAERIRARLAGLMREASISASEADASAFAEAWLNEQVNDPDRPMLEKFHAAAGNAANSKPIADALVAFPGSTKYWAIAGALVRTVDSWQRAFYSAFLSRRFKCLLVGHCGADWEKAGWDVRGDRAGSVPYHELSLHYSRCAAGLNVMRYQDDIGSNIKGLECAASGCVPLQRTRPGMADLLRPDIESVYFDSPVQASERLKAVIDSTERRTLLAAGGRSAVESRHTWIIRAGELLRSAMTGFSARS
ncbi:MAG TPA: glycosyltransferase [Phycisphaerales bacterium]|nr:glycosyltransferase [Phycisphaerales bacterium]